MINTFSKKNLYGGYTHEIELLPDLVIRFTEMNTTLINIELIKKRIFLKDLVHFAFVVKKSLPHAVISAFGEIKFPVRNKSTIDFNSAALDKLENEVLYFMAKHKQEIIKKSINSIDW